MDNDMVVKSFRTTPQKWRKFKLIAVEQDKTMNDLLNEVLGDYIKEKEVHHGQKRQPV